MKAVEPEGFDLRKPKPQKRKRFWAAGVNDIWTWDQHDKWGALFGLWMHCCVEPFSGFILWMQIWWCNRPGQLVMSYYFNTVRRLGCESSMLFATSCSHCHLVAPMFTQSDGGSENHAAANAHSYLRQRLDPNLRGTRQHRWFVGKGKNIKPEIIWSQLRLRWTPGFQRLMQFGVDKFWFDPTNTLDVYVCSQPAPPTISC